VTTFHEVPAGGEKGRKQTPHLDEIWGKRGGDGWTSTGLISGNGREKKGEKSRKNDCLNI